jgi:Holliday junction DNA helicase RuvA
MYEYIKGEIVELTPAYAVVEAAGVGYFLIISLQTFAEIENRKTATVYTHFIVRDDAQILYGFATKHEREIFRLLIGVSGVGGNTARMILSTYAPRELSNIIASENAALLKNVKGLGLKTAQKIIVELRDKMVMAAAGGPLDKAGLAVGNPDNYSEALAALTMLGFPKSASEKALRAVMRDNPDSSVEDMVRLSLKSL